MSIYMSGGLEMDFTDWNRLSILQFCPGTRLIGVNVCTPTKRYKKGHFFTTKSKKKTTPTLTYPYVHDLFTTFLIKQNFEKKKIIKGSVQKSDLVLA